MLGHVDIQASHKTDAAKAMKAEKHFAEFVVAGGDTAELLDAAEEAFFQIAAVVTMFIKSALHQTMATRRNDRVDSVAVEPFENGLGVVGLVGTDLVWMNTPQQRNRFGAVPGLASGKPKSGKAARAVCQAASCPHL